MGDFLHHSPCESCGSKDNRAVYSDGTHCFGCGHHTSDKRDEDVKPSDLKHHEFMYAPLTKRRISKTTCEKYGYMVGNYNGKQVHAEIHKTPFGRIVAHKYRKANKDFEWEGDQEEAGFFGQSLFTPSENISITITEGAIDAMSLGEITECKWPVVSIKGGAQSAKKEVKAQLEWLNKFKEVRLCFDNDEPGQKAAIECAQLFKPGFVKIITLSLKDANEFLIENKAHILSKELMNGKIYRPDHVVNSVDIDWAEIMKPIAKGWDIPFPKLNNMIRGILPRRLYLLSAGFGCGKTTAMKEIALHLRLNYDLKIGSIHLEEGLQETILSYICMDNNIPINEAMENPSIIGADKIEHSKERLYRTGNFVFYKHFGADDVDNLISKIEYFAVGEGCDVVLFDHVTAAVSGIRGGQEGDRKTIDYLMDALRSLIQRTGVTVIAAAQLVKSSNGKGPNNGGEIAIADLRGSGQMAGTPDVILALEGDQQGDEPNKRTIRVLKNRITGKVGAADDLMYSNNTGRLVLDTGVRMDHNEF